MHLFTILFSKSQNYQPAASCDTGWETIYREDQISPDTAEGREGLISFSTITDGRKNFQSLRVMEKLIIWSIKGPKGGWGPKQWTCKQRRI